MAERSCRVVLISRDVHTGEKAAAAIQEKTPGSVLEAMQLDLVSFASIRAFAAAFHAQKLPLHVLINSAGLMVVEKQPKFTQGYPLLNQPMR